LFQVKSIKLNKEIEAVAVAITVVVEVASAVAVAVSPVEVAVSFSFADDRRCLIRESSSSFFTDLSLGGLELT
jgi:hypothetical protein